MACRHGFVHSCLSFNNGQQALSGLPILNWSSPQFLLPRAGVRVKNRGHAMLQWHPLP